ncbi:MAG: hypothetical protein E6J90_17340 [Deltaproteobacteria bacterium]|nr:MAG: hypothetical protein E6J90_17340 [Deltaproteobacteria bacterium]TMQ22656.1 MAG: hypothetical protein E6J91_01045 [Deltaproteobacteria bacterium]
MIRAVCLVLAVLGLAAPGRARADAPAGEAVALLPLDADKSLEIYGQPVASEIARALVAGNVQVVVVGPRMAVPERARLIIDGTIALGRASAVTISIRIRNTLDGVTLETLSATAPGLARIDGAAAELSARVLPLVRERLAALHRPPEDHGRVSEIHGPVAAPDRPLLIAIADPRWAQAAPLARALEAEVASWSRAHHRQVQKLDPGKLTAQAAAGTVAASGSDLALGFWILDYAPEAGAPPMARARVRVQVATSSAVVFDRIVATDTVVGDRGLAPPDLAARVAREVLAILRPHLRRSVPSWP